MDWYLKDNAKKIIEGIPNFWHIFSILKITLHWIKLCLDLSYFKFSVSPFTCWQNLHENYHSVCTYWLHAIKWRVTKMSKILSKNSKRHLYKSWFKTLKRRESEIIQKPQFLPTLLANFCHLTITKLVSDGKWANFGLSPLWKIFFILDHCETFPHILWYFINCPRFTFVIPLLGLIKLLLSQV